MTIVIEVRPYEIHVLFEVLEERVGSRQLIQHIQALHRVVVPLRRVVENLSPWPGRVEDPRLHLLGVREVTDGGASRRADVTADAVACPSSLRLFLFLGGGLCADFIGIGL